MTKRTIKLFLGALLAASAYSPAAAQMSSAELKERIAALQEAIDGKGAAWIAGETDISGLSEKDWKYLVGLNFEPVDAPPLPEFSMTEVPVSFDWRDNEGNFVTPARNQKKCGSCWAFAMTGALESYGLLQKGTPGVDLDLSEQVMLSCSGAGSCNGGRLTATYLQRTGLPGEEVYPYTATDGSCSAAGEGWQAGAQKIGGWGSVTRSIDKMKAALLKYGPLPTAMYVYEDFMHYKSGVYSYVEGKRLGGHAVLLVGYNDEEGYFIVKNSWDKGWGEDGFFRIAYSEVAGKSYFGMSTIAYWPKAGKDGYGAPEAHLHKADDTFGRVAPMLETGWK